MFYRWKHYLPFYNFLWRLKTLFSLTWYYLYSRPTLHNEYNRQCCSIKLPIIQGERFKLQNHQFVSLDNEHQTSLYLLLRISHKLLIAVCDPSAWLESRNVSVSESDVDVDKWIIGQVLGELYQHVHNRTNYGQMMVDGLTYGSK